MRGVPSLQLGLLLVALCVAQPIAQPIRKGEYGVEVSTCRCAGPKATHGMCGYHFHLGSSEAKPWCRTAHGCGQSSMLKGSWDWCDERSVERRRDRGRYYTAMEFKDFYGSDGKQRWMDAKPEIEFRRAGNGKWYTASQFRDYYIDGYGENGWVEKWIAAEIWEEKRQANDGKWYTWAEFEEHYGSEQVRAKWDAAVPKNITNYDLSWKLN